MSLVKVKREKDPAPILALIGGAIAASALEHVVGTIVDNMMKPVDKGAEVASELATYKLYNLQFSIECKAVWIHGALLGSTV